MRRVADSYRRALAEQTLEQAIRRVVDDAPPLSESQILRLIAILHARPDMAADQ